MSAQPSAVNMAMIKRDQEDVEFVRSHLQWKFGMVPGMKPFAANLVKLLRERWAIDLIPAEREARGPQDVQSGAASQQEGRADGR